MADGPDFSPLSDDERAAAAQAQAREGEPDAAKPTLPPADAEPAEAAAVRLFGRKPDALWRYVDATGALAYCACRWNQPGNAKDIRPLSWFDSEGWRFGAWPKARPLYNLDKIAAEPRSPIVVCEGEKAADAAAPVFPKSIATTSSGGAQAAPQSDWTPLKGRRVLIWPDVDKPGADYASEVAAILGELECEVSIIDAAALAAIDPDGGAREPPKKGWDAADALAEWQNIEALRKAATGLTKLFDPGPAYVSFGPYTMDANGLAAEKEVGRGKAKRTESVWIAAPSEVLGACRDPHGQGWGKVLRWRDDDGREHVRHVADADLHGEPAALCGGLAHHGLRIDRARQRDFVGYLSAVRAKRRVTIVSRTGWHEIDGRLVFVLPGETIGLRGGEPVILDAAAHGPYEARGTIEEWREGVAALASGHALAVLAISAALAGPLLHLAGIEGGGVHFFGPSSIGKTTFLNLAASVWGQGATPGYVRAWRATANGLEGAAAGATDTVLILDEVGQVEAREMGPALYSLANGGGKARAARDGALREPRTWRVLTISSGEVPVDARLTEDRGRKTRAGQLVRMLDISADRGFGFGVFDAAGPEGDAGALATTCRRAAASTFGTAGPEFVRRLITDGQAGDSAGSMVANFVVGRVPRGVDGQVDRAARRLGLIAAAGQLATEFGLTGWREGEAWVAAEGALRQWTEGRGGTEAAEVGQAIAQVRHFIEAHGEARFDDAADPYGRPAPNRAGWHKGDKEDRQWLILPEVWKREVCAGLDPRFVAGVLAERGMLIRGGDGNLKVEKIAGTSKRVYVVTPRIFDGGEA